jgi:flagellar protein FliO/FliZ
VGVLLLALLPLAAFAQEAAPQEAKASADARRAEEQSILIPEAPAGGKAVSAEGPLVSSWDFVRMLLVLAAVVAVIYLIFHLLRRGLRRQLPENEIIRVIGSRSLTGNRSLHLVELGTTVFLLGAAEGGITLISEVKDRETLDMVRLESSRQRQAPQGFGQFFQSILKPGAGRASGIEATVDFMKRQRQRLHKM